MLPAGLEPCLSVSIWASITFLPESTTARSPSSTRRRRRRPFGGPRSCSCPSRYLRRASAVLKISMELTVPVHHWTPISSHQLLEFTTFCNLLHRCDIAPNHSDYSQC